MPFYHHADVERRSAQGRPAVRWVKVAWLASLLTLRGQNAVKLAAKAALTAIDNDNPRTLVQALDLIARNATGSELTMLAADASATVSRAMLDGAR